MNTCDTALDYPATHRNRDAISEVLFGILPERGDILEVASGSGQHVAHFGRRFPALRWHPSDPDDACVGSIRAWTRDIAAVEEPSRLDVTRGLWPDRSYAAIVCINMIHIAPWAACKGLMRGAARGLDPSGFLYLYGPYRRGGEHTAPSNARFSEDLRRRDPAWGVREIDDVVAEAARHGLVLAQITEMPANNLSVVFRRGVEPER